MISLVDSVRLKECQCQMDPLWRSGMFGTWGHDERSFDPAGEALLSDLLAKRVPLRH